MHLNIPIHPITDANFDIGALAGALAFANDEIQATFFNEFVTQLQRACDIRRNEGSLGVQMQCLWINKKLSTDAREILSDIGALE